MYVVKIVGMLLYTKEAQLIILSIGVNYPVQAHSMRIL